MEKVLINGEEPFIKDAHQIINMGGPYVGLLMIEDKLISADVIADNFVLDETIGRLYFIKYHQPSKWAVDRYFTINFYETDTGLVYEYKKRFEILYLGEILEKDKMIIYPAFHDAFPEKRILFNTKTESYLPA